MHCRYCGYSNREGDVRCARCDGRLRPPVVSGSSSAVPVEQTQTVETAAIPVAPERWSGTPRQPTLFESGKVLRFPGPATRAMRGIKPKPAKTNRHSTLSGQVFPGTQERLPGMERLRPGLLPHETQAVAVQRSDFPVAKPVVRLKAAMTDAGVVACGFIASLVPFFAAGGHVSTTPKALLGFGAYALVLALFYQVFWCVLRRPSVGEAKKHLRLVTYEGEAPTAGARLLRLGALVLTSLAAGLGPLWALLDEEKLAWHDLISQTYPTRR